MCRVFEIVLNRPKNANRIMGMVDENNCFLCTSFNKDEAGYLMLSVNGKTTRLHRLVFQEFNGEIPEGLEVRHLCHSKSCCNPLHLAVGTHQQNIDDNETNDNSRKSKASLSLSEKKRIIKNKTLTNKELAVKYNVVVRTIYEIKKKAREGKYNSGRVGDKPSTRSENDVKKHKKAAIN